MQNAQITIRLVKHGLTVRRTGRIPFPPVHANFLTGVPLDRRNPHPDSRHPLHRIPLLDLVGQRLAFSRKAHVLTLGLGLAKIEPILIQPHE